MCKSNLIPTFLISTFLLSPNIATRFCRTISHRMLNVRHKVDNDQHHVDISWHNSPSPPWARASSFTRFLDHIQRHITIGRTALDKWSARRRNLYLTTHNTHNRQTSMPPSGIRTNNLSRRTAANLRLRSRGHWDRHIDILTLIICKVLFFSRERLMKGCCVHYHMTSLLINYGFVLEQVHDLLIDNGSTFEQSTNEL